MSWNNLRLSGAIFLAILGLGVGPSYYSYNKGVEHGVDKYHNHCYNSGGIVINQDPPHTIVDCSGLGELTEGQFQDLLKNQTVPKVIEKPLTSV